MKDETRYLGAAAVPITETIRTHARYLSPESSTDRSDPGSQVGKRKVLPHVHSHYAYTVQCVHSIIYREEGLLTTGEKDIQKYWPD